MSWSRPEWVCNEDPSSRFAVSQWSQRWPYERYGYLCDPLVVIWKLLTKKRREVHCHLNLTAENQDSEKKQRPLDWTQAHPQTFSVQEKKNGRVESRTSRHVLKIQLKCFGLWISPLLPFSLSLLYCEAGALSEFRVCEHLSFLVSGTSKGADCRGLSHLPSALF